MYRRSASRAHGLICCIDSFFDVLPLLIFSLSAAHTAPCSHEESYYEDDPGPAIVWQRETLEDSCLVKKTQSGFALKLKFCRSDRRSIFA